MDSILTSVKKMLGIEETYTHFDPELVMHINSVLMVLTQMGVGPSEGFAIADATSKWTDFISDLSKLEAVKTYTALKVRLIFDPPANGSAINAMNSLISEFEWRLYAEADGIIPNDQEVV